MSVTTRPSNKYFYYEITFQGKKYIKSTRTTNKKLATKIDEEYYQEIVEQVKLGGKDIKQSESRYFC